MSAPKTVSDCGTYDPSQVVVAGTNEGMQNYGEPVRPARMTDRSGRALPETYEVTIKPHMRKGSAAWRAVCERLEQGPNSSLERRILKRIRKRLLRQGANRLWEYQVSFDGLFVLTKEPVPAENVPALDAYDAAAAEFEEP